MALSLDRRTADRFVKVLADLGEVDGGGPYRLSTGFIVCEGTVLTSAHGVAGAKSVRISDLHQRSYPADLTSSRSGDPTGPAVDKPPDLALLSVPGLGTGLRRFPIARLSRSSPSLTVLREVHVVGFPAFVQTSSRTSFHDTGSVPLLSRVETGLIDVALSASPPEFDPRENVSSQWAGISGAPVIIDGHLIALVTEHSRRMGPARLTATPLSLLDSDPEWPAGGPGMTDAGAWWARLGVGDPEHLPVLPGRPVSAAWIHDLQLMEEELNAQHPWLPLPFRAPADFAAQAHEALLECFRGLSAPDFAEVARRLPECLERPENAPGSSVYGVATKEVLTSQNLTTVLDRLLAVHGVAATWPRNQLERLKYRLTAPRVAIEDLEHELDRWAGQAKDESTARELIARLDITTRDDAYGDLLACLSNAEWNRWDPVRSVRSLVDLIFAEELTAPEAAEHLEKCFTGQSLTAATALTGEDTEPDDVVQEERGFLVNEQPTLAHLRDGYFAPAQNLDRLEEAYWAWYEREIMSGAHRRSGRVPTFWLTGPSGAGKSILLLQFLARLNTRAGVSVLWLDDTGEALGRATEQASRLSPDRHVVIGVDDPVMIFDQGGDDSGWRAAFDALGRRRHTGAPSLPIFICCAPTEHYARFRQAYAGAVEIERYPLDPYRRSFTDHLRRWYQDRTGHSAREPADEETLLPAQLFFEWWKGEGIRAFARRFRNRLLAAGLPELVGFFERLLALNRLYVGYPSKLEEALTPEVRDALAGLQLDMHVNRPTVTRPGYWLSHPQLANAIYNEWFPDDSNHEWRRGAHLRAALLDVVGAEEDGQASLSLLEQLLVICDPVSAQAGEPRMSAGQASAALAAGAEVVGPAADALSLPVLASWVKVEWRFPGCPGEWSPLADAIARLRTVTGAELGLRVLVTTLAQLGETTADQALWEFLRGHPDWHYWTSTAALLVDRTLTEEQAAIVAAAVAAHPGDADAIGLLATALRHRPVSASLVSLAQRLVDGRIESTVPVASLAAGLMTLNGRSEEIASTWLSAEVRRENGVVFAEILRRERPSLSVWGELAKWLVAYPTEDAADAGFARVATLQRLASQDFREALAEHLRRRDAFLSPELATTLRRLLNEDHRGWSSLLTLLTPAQLRGLDARTAALPWLERNRDAPPWHHVYVHLCDAAPAPDPELVEIGRGQLPRAWTFGHCARVLSSMLRLAPDDQLADLALTSRRWLKDNPDSDWWGILVRPVIQATPLADVETMAAEFVQWWLDHPDRPSTSYVVRAVLAAPISAEMHRDLVEHAVAWLDTPRTGWDFVFLSLLPFITEERAATIALPWLRQGLTRTRWVAVFAAIIEQLTVEEVTEISLMWFGRPADVDSTAGFLWRIVMEEGPCREKVHDPAYREVINAWLTDHGSLRSWWHIWREMYTAEPADLETVTAAMKADIPQERSHAVANTIGKTVTARPELTDPTWEFMRTRPRNQTWQLICLSLLSVAPTTTGWDVCVDHLPAVEPEHYYAWWKVMWKAFPEHRQRSALRSFGRAWIEAHPGEPGATKLSAKLEEDAATRITPATVFGSRAPRVRTASVVTPTAPAARPVVTDAGRITCARCGHLIEMRALPPGMVKSIVCLHCHARLSLDTATGTLSLQEVLQVRHAVPIGATTKTARNARPVVHCDTCGRDLRAILHTADTYVAIDLPCGLLHEVPMDLMDEYVEGAARRVTGDG